jgi:hypothetical protein
MKPMRDERKRRVRIERVLIAILVHGPEAAFDHVRVLRYFYRYDKLAFQEIAICLRANGMEQHEVLDIVIDQHPADCACWRCLLRTHVDILKTRATVTDGSYDFAPPAARPEQETTL